MTPAGVTTCVGISCLVGIDDDGCGETKEGGGVEVGASLIRRIGGVVGGVAVGVAAGACTGCAAAGSGCVGIFEEGGCVSVLNISKNDECE
jgi:hypothetical protein